MLYRFLVVSLFLTVGPNAWGKTPDPAPLFLNYTKTYDLNNKKNLALRQKSKKGVQLAEEQAVLTAEADFWEGLAPKLTEGQKNKIAEFNKINAHQEHQTGAFGGPIYQHHQQNERLESIKSDFLNTYLNDQVLNGWLVPTLKKANPSLDNLEKNVKKLGEIGADNKEEVESTPAEEAKTQEMVAQETPKEEEWQVDTGTRFDLLRQRGRGWFNCEFFNSEASIDAGGFNKLNYKIKVHKDLVISDDPELPFHVVRAALSSTQDGQVGEINTKLSENLNLSYTNEFNNHNSSVIFNYAIGF